MTARAFQTLPGDRRFFSVMAVITSATILTGFSRTYLPKVVAGAPDVPPIVHLHAAVFTCWLALFVAQTTLVRTGRVALHRRLGIAGVALAALMLVVGIGTSITVARLGHRGSTGVQFRDVETFLLLNMGAVFVFAILVAAGWQFRRNAQTHKRLMLMANVGALVGPGVSRLPFVSTKPPLIGLVVLAFLFAGPVYDLATRHRVHPAYMFGVLLSLATIPPVVEQVAATGAWRSIAAFLVG